jgi:DNA-binding CsgD family transcriptional regulator
VAGRLRGVDAAIRPVLELVACGEPLPLAMLDQVADEASVHAAEESGMVVVERSGARVWVRLAHPLYGEVLRSALAPGRARTTWRRLAETALAMPMRRNGDALRAAVWQVSGASALRPEVIRAGARQAVDRSDLPLAEQLARAARDAAPGPEADCLLAEILEYRGRSAEAAAVLPPDPPAPGPQRALWAVARASTAYWGAGDLASASRTLDLAVGGPGDDLSEATRAWILVFDGKCVDALACACRVLDRPDACVQALIWASAVGTAAAGFLGRCGEAVAIHQRGHAIAADHRGDLPWGLVEMGYAKCLLHLATGDLRAAWTVAAEGYRTAVEEHASLVPGSWAGFRGLVEAAMGRPATAAASLREAVAVIEFNDTFRFVRCCMAGLAGASALTGDAAEARTWLDRADRLANGANGLFAPWIELHRAWTEASAGVASRSIAVARHAAALAKATGLPTVEAAARYDVVRLGGRADVARSRRLAALLGTPFAGALAGAAAGHATADGEALADAGATFEALGHELLAAEAMSAAARAYRRTGRRSTANLCAERAAALRGRCEGARTPLVDRSGATGVLTAREREVVLLAAHSSSREIADKLGLSTRTVDNNLARAYAKLGISGRAELRSLLAVT